MGELVGVLRIGDKVAQVEAVIAAWVDVEDAHVEAVLLDSRRAPLRGDPPGLIGVGYHYDSLPSGGKARRPFGSPGGRAWHGDRGESDLCGRHRVGLALDDVDGRAWQGRGVRPQVPLGAFRCERLALAVPRAG